ncbi:MAG: hypothetical protein Q9195_009050 [Heterodermia aff. obscurata]
MAPLVASMAILPRQPSDTIKNFGLIAIHSASPIHLSSVNAAGDKFWIGKDTQTFCPAIQGLDCSHFQNITAFSQGSKSDFLGLDTEVPGGQSVYVNPKGALSFTVAHSAATPAGSTYESFKATVKNSASTLGDLKYNGTDSFVACPTTGKKGQRKGPYQVFVDVNNSLKDKDVPGGCVDECIGFLAATVKLDSKDSPAAWQYE